MKRLITILHILLLSIITVHAQQKFYNLTSQDVKIDTIMPSVAYDVALPMSYKDTLYSVVMKYPEYIEMTKKDIEAYKKLQGETLPPESPEIATFITFARKKPHLSAILCPIVYREGKYMWVVSFMLELQKKANTSEDAGIPTRLKANSSGNALTRAGENDPISRYAAHSVLAKGKWAKVSVSKNGIHKLTPEVAKRAGFNDFSKVKIYGYGGNLIPEKLSEKYIIEHDDLQEVPTCTVNGQRLFYGKGTVSWDSPTAKTRTRNPYSDLGYYFITESEGEPLTCTEEELLKIVEKSADRYHTLYEKDEFAWYESGRNLVEKQKITTTGRTYKLNVPEGNTTATLTAYVSSDAKTKFEVLCNDSLVTTSDINLTDDYDKCKTVGSSYLIRNPKAENTITVRVESGAAVRLDYLAMQFDTPEKLPELASADFPSAEYVYNITTQDLHSDAGYDMVIIIPTTQKLLSQAERIAQLHREKDGMKVRLVPADEIYNEFSSGTPDASAYKRYMKMLYDKATDNNEEGESDKAKAVKAPSHLLLFGDAVFDNRMLTDIFSGKSPDDYLLCFESENSYNSVYSYVCEDFFGMLDDDEAITRNASYIGIPDIAIGRFPCTTDSEAKILVDKTINYATNTTRGKWQNSIAFLGDDGNENLHMRDINDVAESIIRKYPGYHVHKVMWDAFKRVSNSNNVSFPDVENLVRNLQNDGVLVLDYAGHANATTISDEHVIDLKNITQFRGNNLPLWVTACCDIVPFDATIDNIGESVLLNAKGGALAFFGTTRTVLATYNNYINREFMKNVLSYDKNGKPITIGEATRLSKENIVTKGEDLTVNKLQYVLLGDPALSLALPELSIVVDEVNDVSDFKKNNVDLHSTEVVKVKGHLERGNEKATDFTGIINALVRDTRQLITCRLSNTTSAGASKPFTYYDRTKVLFQGTDSVRNGNFEFIFAVPTDINNDDGTGKINFYALSEDKSVSANGYFDTFHIKKGDSEGDNTTGPSIYCYLNSPNFTYGGMVNSTPFFVAEVSDKDGINSSGAGIGHDLMLTIDDDINRYYILNDNFQYDFGSYTSGQTYMVLPPLEEGKHTLTFTAWDILNNPSTSKLEFYVQKGLAPYIADISVTKNPARDNTTFIVTHDRNGSVVNMQIEVMDASGRLLWTTTETGTSNGTTYTYDWNLTLDNGQKLETGVYLYRISLACDGSTWSSKAKKLVVVSSR